MLLVQIELTSFNYNLYPVICKVLFDRHSYIMNAMNDKFAMLVVLDGWGIAPDGNGNAMSQAQLPNIRSLMAGFPHTQLGASGESVGLPRGEVGNTETGHLNLGAGRIVYQDLARINMSIADGSFFENATLKSLVEHIKKNDSSLHLMGLIGAGGVHSNIEHLYALLHFAALNGLTKVYLHAFTDGRDSPPNASATYLSQVQEVMNREKVGSIASVMGRYWAMDRDLRWDRTGRAYYALTRGEGHLYKSVKEIIDDSYSRGQTDEFIEPSLVSNASGTPLALIKSNDAVLFFNFRIDRPRQLARAFMLPDIGAKMDFDPYAIKYEKKHLTEPKAPSIGFDRGPLLTNLSFVTMTEYEKPLTNAGVKAIFPPEQITMPLGRAISVDGLRQLHASESEKERFVTFYFNGQQEQPFPGEDRLIVPSPKVPTYDLKPEMSARELTAAVIEKLSHQNDYSFVVLNFANADMVGHTGNLAAAIKAIETLDECIGKLSSFILSRGGLMIITADHGNAEEMINVKTGAVSTEHSDNPVPFIAISGAYQGHQQTLSSGILADVAPTILSYLGLEIPGSMMGRNLLADLTHTTISS